MSADSAPLMAAVDKTVDSVKETVDSVKETVVEAKGRFTELKKRRPSVRHVADAWALMQRNRGNQFAAAITYFSFLALFPLLLLGVSVLGFVLTAHPDLMHRVLNGITNNVPGSFGTTLRNSVKQAINARAGVGVIGLLGVLFTGLGWIGNLRSAVLAVWGKPPPKLNFLKAKANDLVILIGLGIALVLSLGLTVAGTALTDQVLRALSLQNLPGFHVLLHLAGLALGVAGDFLIFWWMLVKLPDVEV